MQGDPRTEEEIRSEIATERQQLADALADLRKSVAAKRRPAVFALAGLAARNDRRGGRKGVPLLTRWSLEGGPARRVATFGDYRRRPQGQHAARILDVDVRGSLPGLKADYPA